MKITELIEELKKVKQEHGDLEIETIDETRYKGVIHGYFILMKENETLTSYYIPV